MSDQTFLEHTYVVILCGGGGTRVWPLSVKQKPKQFINFYSDNTLYQDTVERAKKVVPVERIIIITNEAYKDEIIKETPEIPTQNIIAEPMKRNTAMAMGFVAAVVKKRDPEAVLVNLASDHTVGEVNAFVDTLLLAASVAYEDKVLVSVGIKPTFPHPGLGYIHIGEKLKDVNNTAVSKVAAFKEKPDIATATRFLETGEYLWNANFYTWRCDTILEAFDTLSPVIADHIHTIENTLGTNDEMRVMQEEYEKVPEEQIDTAISEKADNLVVISGDFDWNDIGSWQVVYDLGEKDANGNVVVQNREIQQNTPVITYDAKNNYIFYNNQPLAVVGLSNIVVVDTGNGILVCDRSKCNDVKKVVEELKAKGFEQYL